jgi:cellobiose-specific phosphotransferase system component IIA
MIDRSDELREWYREDEPPEPVSLPDAHAVFRRWLGEDYDTDALNAVMAAAAVEHLDGDPLWLLLISGSGNAKTETVQALDGIDAIVTSTISSCGALLSATPRKERAHGATGGLLRKLEPRGVLVIKDVTSILSMSGEARAEVLGALREVYDGRWSRNVGTDGGQTLEWAGRIAVVGAVTTAWDKAHAAIASMGDRFVLVRMDSTTGRQQAGRRAIGNTGSEIAMRAELAVAVAGVLAGMDTTAITVTDAETDVLLAAADLVTLARTGVEYDYRGDVIDAHAPEMPTRFAKQLAQVVRGGTAIGMDRTAALRLAIRCARDSMPPLRLAIIDDVAAHAEASTAEVRRRIGKPRATTDRQLQALHMLGVLECDEHGATWAGKDVTRWQYRLADGINPNALDPKSVPDLALHTPNPQVSRDGQGPAVRTPPAKSGTAPPAASLPPAGIFTADPPCFYCDGPVTGKHKDGGGRYVHHSCAQAADAAEALPL